MDQLHPRIRAYAWGSHEALARLTGRSHPTPEPEAELWMGAHEAAPAGLVRHGGETTLDRVVAADPVGELGAGVADRYGGRLPFLLKVLAPERALSIQAHPTAAQARDAAAGTYADDWPKPEAFVAISPFEVFAGTRDFSDTAGLAARLDVPTLSALVAVAAEGEAPAYDLLAALLGLPADKQAELVVDVLTACAQRSELDPDAALLEAVLRVADDYPGDIGVVVLLTMVHQVVQPGHYVFVPAGVLHAYVRGVAVEILANSDNVVRAGLTPKRIDVAELLRIVDVDQAMTPQTPSVGEDGWSAFPADTGYFRLHTTEPDATPRRVRDEGQPRILLALEATVTVCCGEAELLLGPGDSCFLSATDEPATVAGGGRVYLATPGPCAIDG